MHDKDLELDSAYCTLHNLGASLSANQQSSDIEWLARVLFEHSRLGAGDIKTVPWLIDVEQWDYLMLEPQALLGDGPRHWQALTNEQQEAWQKLARICLYVLPSFASRVGHRYMEQARALQQVWRQERQEAQRVSDVHQSMHEINSIQSCPECWSQNVAAIAQAPSCYRRCEDCSYEWLEEAELF